ncbi:hypothetical protein [Roseibium sp.]|uniref:hypothetical protein n=1 Tax=Roseibium sp. TaxID=1936156 RepID=UPI003BAB0FD0
MTLFLGIAALAALMASVVFLLLLPFTPGRRSRLLGGSIGFLFTSITCATLAYSSDLVKLAEYAREGKNGSPDDCGTAMDCWLDKSWRTATLYCPAIIERFAMRDFEWIDGLLEPKFNGFRLENPQGSAVTMIGDKLRFQNSSGEWLRMTYECDVLPDTDIIVDVRVDARD